MKRVRLVDSADTESLVGRTGTVGGVYTFEVPGPPRGKGRPRFGRTGDGRPVTFTDPETVAFENLVMMCAASVVPKQIEGPVSVAIVAKLPRTKTRVQPPATIKPDIDNIEKAVLDGLRAHFRDEQVTTLLGIKERCEEGEQPRTVVRIEVRFGETGEP